MTTRDIKCFRILCAAVLRRMASQRSNRQNISAASIFIEMSSENSDETVPTSRLA